MIGRELVVVVQGRDPVSARELQGTIHGRATRDQPATVRLRRITAALGQVLEADVLVLDGAHGGFGRRIAAVSHDEHLEVPMRLRERGSDRGSATSRPRL